MRLRDPGAEGAVGTAVPICLTLSTLWNLFPFPGRTEDSPTICTKILHTAEHSHWVPNTITAAIQRDARYGFRQRECRLGSESIPYPKAKRWKGISHFHTGVMTSKSFCKAGCEHTYTHTQRQREKEKTFNRLVWSLEWIPSPLTVLINF